MDARQDWEQVQGINKSHLNLLEKINKCIFMSLMILEAKIQDWMAVFGEGFILIQKWWNCKEGPFTKEPKFKGNFIYNSQLSPERIHSCKGSTHPSLQPIEFWSPTSQYQQNVNQISTCVWERANHLQILRQIIAFNTRTQKQKGEIIFVELFSIIESLKYLQI